MADPLMELSETPTIDTNEEYIIPTVAKKEPTPLVSVFRAIVIETIKDFFGGIMNFLLRYLRHFINCFWYFWSPTIEKHPFDKLDYKQNSKHSFELALMVLFAAIFMEKVDWIPPANKELLENYNNDLSQMMIQLMMFGIFAITFLLLSAFSIYTGRLFRRILKIKIPKPESDILQIYLNNAFYNITAVVAFIFRCMTNSYTGDSESIGMFLTMVLAPFIILSLLVWGIRYCILHKLNFGKSVLFVLMSLFAYGLFYIVSGLLICGVMLAL